MIDYYHNIVIALVSGFIPTLVWLWFWQREDRKKPEPFYLIVIAFLGGMVATIISFFLEKITAVSFISPASPDFVIYASPIIEEVIKFSLALYLVLRRDDNDEPIDATIYLITVGLGFAALENTFYIFDNIRTAGMTTALAMGDLRFLGAAVLHTLSCATIGVFWGLAFYKNWILKTLAIIFGLALAILLHSAYNYFIISTNNQVVIVTLGLIWFGAIVLMLILEKVKLVRPGNRLKDF